MSYFKTKEPGTLAAKLGFQDTDLKTPEHDEMMLWLDGRLRDHDGDGFLIDLVRWEQPVDWTPEEIVDLQTQAMRLVGEQRDRLVHKLTRLVERGAYDAESARRSLQELAEYQPPTPQPPLPPSLKTATWEKPVGDSRWVAGFIDLFVEVDDIVHATGFESSVQTSDGYLWLPRFVVHRRAPELYAFEVKTAIPSLGDLVRQVRFYQAKWTGRGQPTFYIASGDTRFAGPLQSQGIGFVEYPSGEITHPEER